MREEFGWHQSHPTTIQGASDLRQKASRVMYTKYTRIAQHTSCKNVYISIYRRIAKPPSTLDGHGNTLSTLGCGVVMVVYFKKKSKSCKFAGKLVGTDVGLGHESVN